MDAASRGPSPMFLESTPTATPVRGARARLQFQFQWLDGHSVPLPVIYSSGQLLLAHYAPFVLRDCCGAYGVRWRLNAK
jgi:hypothetical protein